MRYWWVNHKQTVRQEIAGGYLWSPKRTAGGARNQVYDNMRIAAAGDAVISFADGRVAFVGIVSGRAIEEGKPKSFGSTGDYWSDDGWWLPVNWVAVEHPLIAQTSITEFRQWLPSKYSPINPHSGKGNQGAYLAEIPEELFHYVIQRTEANPWAIPAEEMALQAFERVADTDWTANFSVSKTEQDQVVKARRGQGLFRFRVSQIEPACRLTGITNPTLLVASHIKPWKDCESGMERLDGANGLMLTPHVDRLFDKGLISFSEKGAVRQSKWLKESDVARLGLAAACERNAGVFTPRQQEYLEFHRSNIFDREPSLAA